MATARALLVGLKGVDASKYGGWDGVNGCQGCELDVDNIDHILSALNYKTVILKTQAAKASAVLSALKKAAADSRKGDIFVFYYSGHGGQQPDENGDELDGQDETLVAYNREIIDDELNKIWPKFRAGVRIVMLSDSCNSGTNYRMVMRNAKATPIQPITDAQIAQSMVAQLIHMGGCRDGMTSDGYLHGGAFTIALCKVWKGGGFKGGYKDFLTKIRSSIKSGQKPQYNEYGPVSAKFRKQKPFTV